MYDSSDEFENKIPSLLTTFRHFGPDTVTSETGSVTAEQIPLLRRPDLITTEIRFLHCGQDSFTVDQIPFLWKRFRLDGDQISSLRRLDSVNNPTDKIAMLKAYVFNMGRDRRPQTKRRDDRTTSWNKTPFFRARLATDVFLENKYRYSGHQYAVSTDPAPPWAMNCLCSRKRSTYYLST